MLAPHWNAFLVMAVFWGASTTAVILAFQTILLRYAKDAADVAHSAFQRNLLILESEEVPSWEVIFRLHSAFLRSGMPERRWSVFVCSAALFCGSQRETQSSAHKKGVAIRCLN